MRVPIALVLVTLTGVLVFGALALASTPRRHVDIARANAAVAAAQRPGYSCQAEVNDDQPEGFEVICTPIP